MSAHPSPAQPAAVSPADAGSAVSSAEIDASCRVPVMLLFICAALWLLAASGFGVIATLKFHSPGFLADCAWLTYGRVHPAQLNAAIYGFAIQAGLGAILWLFCHLSRARLASVPTIVIGTILWNIGVKLGIIGILYGDNTGHEWLEMPRYASIILFCSYLLIGYGAMRTFILRREGPLYISQWFLLAAVFWFPWIYSTANFLLVAHPVRGALQAALNGWYITNLTAVFLGFIGLGTIFYFIPKMLKRPLHSHYLGVFTFWTLALFGSWGGIAPGSPLPSWMAAMSTVAAVLTIVPLLAVAINLRRTIAGDFGPLLAGVPGKFMLFGLAAFLIGGVATALNSLETVNVITNFTWVTPALTQLEIYGFFAMTMFGVIYYVVPRLMGAELSPKLAGAQFWISALGILLLVLPLALGGLNQGGAMNLHNSDFFAVMQSTLTFLRVSTVGDLLLAAGHVLLCLNLIGLLYRVGRLALTALLADNRAGAVEGVR